MLSQDQMSRNVCYLETIGRSTGSPHEIEIWFASTDGVTIHMMAGGRDNADWVRNLRVNPHCRLRLDSTWFTGTAREVEDTPLELETRKALAAKYYGWTTGDLPNDWSKNALPIIFTLCTDHQM